MNVSSTRAGLVAAGTLALISCQETVNLQGDFAGPIGAAVLLPETGGPFSSPVAFVSNSRSGTIVPLDLKHGWQLADDPAAPFMDAAALATGSDRILGELLVYAPDSETVTLWVADTFSETLVQVPYVTGVDDSGAPITVGPTVVSETSFDDVDGSGDLASLVDLRLRSGAAGSEDWTVRYSGTEWQVVGSRSGEQLESAYWMQPYRSDNAALEFMVTGTATQGDEITFSVSTGVVEHDLGGLIQGLWMAPDQSLMLAAITDRDTGLGRVIGVDPASGLSVGELLLPDAVQPYRLSANADGSRVFIADARAAGVHEVELNAEDLAASPVRVIATEGPVVDMTWQGTEDFEHLFVAVLDTNRVDLYDLETDTWTDVNPATPELDGMDVQTPVTGLVRGLSRVQFAGEDEDGLREYGYVVGISTFEGVLMGMDAETGCLISDNVGPYAELDGDYPFEDSGATSNPSMYNDNSTGRSIQLTSCAGLVESESWTVTYDGSMGDWVVQGNRSGAQANRAVEDERYLSDAGTVSFTILSGSLPSTNGDRFNFRTLPGVAEASGDLNGDGNPSEVGVEVPGRPVPYVFTSGPDSDEGWELANKKVGVVWPITNSDNVMRVNLQSMRVDAIWD